MLNNVKIDGFKSLSKFSFDINPGLNVLVGINGSGKTTIIKALEFISYLITRSIFDAISEVGGAREVFDRSRISEENRDAQTLSIEFSGAGSESRRLGNKTQPFIIDYNYSAQIMFDPEKAEVGFTEQHLRVFLQRRNNKNKNTTLKMTYKDEKLNIESSNIAEYMYIFGKEINQIEGFLKENASIFKTESIISQIYFFRPISIRMMRDVAFGKAYNIIPDQVKRDEDIASNPIINADGSGLAATLFHASRSEAEVSQDFEFYSLAIGRPRPKYDKTVITKITELMQLVNKNIIKIEITPNISENKIMISASIENDNNFTVPLRHLSDGTVKWLTLCTIMLGNPHVFILEEPENFLHPKMLSEIISLIRSAHQKNKDSFFLLSTHSESLLNLLKPQEIIFSDYRKGKTTIRRLSNATQLKRQVDKSGFGLGWFYVANAFEVEND